jgi:long-chain acyl-CoA synthetase
MLHHAANIGGRPAMREKRHGIWQITSWSQYAAIVLRLAAGLAARGFGRGDTLAVIGENRPRLYASLLAAQCLGGAGVPLWPDAEPEWIARVLRHASVSVVVAEDHQQVGSLLALRNQLPSLTCLIHLESHGMQQHDSEWLQSFDAVLASDDSRDHAVTEAIKRVEPPDLALLLYGADAAGEPHGVMLSHGNQLAAANALAATEDVRQTDEVLAWLPMAWFGDVLTSQALALATGYTCNCPEAPETARRDLREIGPTVLLAPPHIWESMLAGIETKTAQATPLKRALFVHSRNVAERAEALREVGEPISLALRAGTALGEVLVYAPLRDQIGLRRTRWALSVGEPLAPHVLRFFNAIGVNLKQAYGIPELSGIAMIQHSACSGFDITVAASGEVVVRSASVCSGYFRDPDRTRQALTEDDKWRTGDAGYVHADGRVAILDRVAHIRRLDDGTQFVPWLVERQLLRSPLIDEAMAFHDSKSVAAIIAINRERVGEWAERQKITHTSLADLVALPEVRGLFREEILRLGGQLAPGARVRRFVLLDRPLGIDDSETMLSRELRRRSAEQAHADLIAALLRDGVTATEVPDEVDAAGRVSGVFIEDIGESTVSWAPAHA